MRETVIKPEELRPGMSFCLIGDDYTVAERKDQNVYEVTSRDMSYRCGAHVMVRDQTGLEREMKISPFAQVWKLEL